MLDVASLVGRSLGDGCYRFQKGSGLDAPHFGLPEAWLTVLPRHSKIPAQTMV